MKYPNIYLDAYDCEWLWQTKLIQFLLLFFFNIILYKMDQYATNIDDLPLVYDEQPEFQDENVNIKIQKEEEKGFYL